MTDKFWGVLNYDNFAREEYSIGEFATEAEAKMAAEKWRESNRAQAEELRDSI